MANNFPTSLNNGTSLANNRITNDAIPPADHNDLANAQIAVETKLGYSSSTPTTVGDVLTVTSAGQTAYQAPAILDQVTYINVKSYGALGNGAQDDTTFIQAAIDDALATDRGTAAVYFPAGTYKITSTLNCSSATVSTSGKGVFLVGDGRESSQIFKNGNGIATEWLGYGGPGGNPTAFGGMRDITVNGNAHTGAAIHVVGGQQMEFSGISVIGNSDVALDLDTTQDSYFYDITFNNCGSTTKRVIEIYGSADGTANMLWFTQIRVETYFKGAVYIYAPSAQRAANGGNNGFFFNQCKFENYPTVRGDHFVADSWTQQLVLDNIFFSCGVFDSGYSTAANAILFGDGGASSPGANQASFRNIFYNVGPTSNLGAAAIKIDGNSVLDGVVTIDNVTCVGTALTRGLFDINGASGIDLDIRQFGYSGTKYNGDNTGHPSLCGQATLSSGTVTVSTSRVRSTSRIFLTVVGTGTGLMNVGTITAGTSFVIHSSDSSDSRVVNWEVRN